MIIRVSYETIQTATAFNYTRRTHGALYTAPSLNAQYGGLQFDAWLVGHTTTAHRRRLQGCFNWKNGNPEFPFLMQFLVLG